FSGRLRFCLCTILRSHVLHRDLLSSPTRRSSDLRALRGAVERPHRQAGAGVHVALDARAGGRAAEDAVLGGVERGELVTALVLRSEEHTSELQSRENLVCRLLLEKKNNISDSSAY